MTIIRETFDTADSDTLGPNLTWVEEGWNFTGTTANTSADFDVVSNKGRIISLGLDNFAYARTTNLLATQDHYVKATLRSNQTTPENEPGLMARKANSTTISYYLADLRYNLGVLSHNVGVAGTFSGLGEVTMTLNANTDYNLVMILRGSSLLTFLDGVLENAVTDSSRTGNLATGIHHGTGVGGLSGALVDFDNFEAGDLPITLVNVGTEGDAASGNVTPGLPASIANDDVLICVCHSSDQVSHSMSGAWVQLAQGNGGSTSSRLSVWAHRYDGVNSPSAVITHASGSGISAGIAAFRGCRFPPNIVGSITGGTDTTIEHAGVTPTIDFSVVLVINGSADDSSRTLLGGYTNVFEDSTAGVQNAFIGTAGVSFDESCSMFYRDVLAVATGTITVTQTSAIAWASVLVVLEPAGTTGKMPPPSNQVYQAVPRGAYY